MKSRDLDLSGRLLFATLELAHPERINDAIKQAHRAWIDRGVQDGVFQLVGNLVDTRGGVILAACSSDELAARLEADPFVAEGIVRASFVAFDAWAGAAHPG